MQTVLADGTPDRIGFLATADPNNGSLLVNQVNTIYRVIAAPGGGFGENLGSVTEPPSIEPLLSGPVPRAYSA